MSPSGIKPASSNWKLINRFLQSESSAQSRKYRDSSAYSWKNHIYFLLTEYSKEELAHSTAPASSCLKKRHGILQFGSPAAK